MTATYRSICRDLIDLLQGQLPQQATADGPAASSSCSSLFDGSERLPALKAVLADLASSLHREQTSDQLEEAWEVALLLWVRGGWSLAGQITCGSPATTPVSLHPCVFYAAPPCLLIAGATCRSFAWRS